MKHRRFHVGMNADEIARFFELFEKRVRRFSFGETLHLIRVRAHRFKEKLIGYLRVTTIEQPGVTRYNPGDDIWINAVA